MSDKLYGYDENSKRRIANLTARLIEAKIASGEIPCTEEAIKAALPEAFDTAKTTINAVLEFLS